MADTIGDTLPSGIASDVPDSITLDGDERYRPDGMIGKGGMGVVHARIDRRIGRRVACKELRPDVAMDPTLRARFVREARVQGQLEHPAIVPVYDIGVRADGAPYFTMKDITGGDNRLVVLPTALDLPRVPTLTLVIGAAAAGVLIGTVIIGYIRDRLASAERRLYLYNGQLRQLLEIEMPMLTKTTARRG